MRIGYLTPGSVPMPPAGCTSVEIYSDHLARELSRTHRVTLYAKGLTPGTRTVGSLTIRRYVTPGGRHYLRQALRHLRNRPPHLLHVENRIPFILPLRTRFPKTPILLNLHSNVLIRSQPDIVVRRALREIDALVVNSQFLKSDLLARCPVLNPSKLHVIHPGLQAEHFPSRFTEQGLLLRRSLRERLGVPLDRRVLLYVGRFIPRKGIDVLLDAFRRVRRTHPNTELWIVGGRPSENTPFHNKLRAKAAGLPVRFLGFLKQSRLPACYAAADLFLCPSQQAEAFGLVNLEAAAAGLLVLASGNWGLRESVAEECLVREYRNPAAWAERICEELDDPERLEEKGRQARRWVTERYSWERTADRFRALYKSLPL